MTLTRCRRWIFAAAAAWLVLAIGGGVLLAADVYSHHRVQSVAGVNMWGYRGPTIGAKRPNERRVAVLGGSRAFGYGLRWNEAFPFYLERQLNARAERGRSFRVVNLGAPGQGAFGFRFDLDDYAYLRYDVAILYEGYNDLGAADLPPAVPPRDSQNRLLWWRQSPVFLTFAAGVMLFALRTWWYTGVFGVLYGTSLKNNDTGLRLSTIGSPEVWRRIAHSLSALVWMNEPPHVDPRAILVAGGAALSILALLQLPFVSRLPGAVAIVTLAGCASSLFAHTHNYPGRMSIHLVPFAVAMSAVFAASIVAVRNSGHEARSVAGGVPA